MRFLSLIQGARAFSEFSYNSDLRNLQEDFRFSMGTADYQDQGWELLEQMVTYLHIDFVVRTGMR